MVKRDESFFALEIKHQWRGAGSTSLVHLNIRSQKRQGAHYTSASVYDSIQYLHLLAKYHIHGPMHYYRAAQYLCPCGNSEWDHVTKLPKAMTPANLWRLPDLYFCSGCSVLRCRFCCVVSVECKYCARCMADYTGVRGVTRCQKNCFECPQCQAPLTVVVKDAVKDKVRGKQFEFRCGICPYVYETRVVTQPMALANIVKGERNSEFSRLASFWGEARSSVKEPSDPAVAARMAKMGIRAPMNEEDRGTVRAREKTKQCSVLKEQLPTPGDKAENSEAGCSKQDSGTRTAIEPALSLPLGHHLTAKRSFACGLCRAPLCVPTSDPRLMKFAHKQFAVDMVPTVCARALGPLSGEVACTLSVMNPLPASITMTAAVVLQNPHGAHVAMPITTFSVQGHKASVAASVPTVYLTGRTSQARAEQLERAVRRGPLLTVEVGPNWTAVPFTMTLLEGGEPVVPFYLTVEQVSGSKFGFWVVCQVEEQ